jgi:hypothetical protein
MPLKLPPSRLGSGIDKDRPYTVFSGEGEKLVRRNSAKWRRRAPASTRSPRAADAAPTADSAEQ